MPFGRQKKSGYFLREVKPPANIQIKEIISTLDEHSFIPKELFELCLWISDYYFANVADVLDLTLPASLRKKSKINYFWNTAGDNLLLTDFKIQDELLATIRPNKKITFKNLNRLKRQNKQLLKQLIEKEMVLEKFEISEPESQLKKYSINKDADWKEFFYDRAFEPEIFSGMKSRKELLESNWSDYLIRKTVEMNLLEIKYMSKSTEILDFISAKENLAKITLTEEQRRVLDQLTGKLSDKFNTFLLHGVTGSGKTIVYCRLIDELLKSGKTALVLTPEIALAGTTLSYFRGIFNEQVTVIHSSMSEQEKLSSWNGIRKGKFKIVIGPRSALFAPLPDLGLIIVDEEHDSSYKQDEPSPRFHGRDAAIMRAKINRIPLILGSASPSFESYYNMKEGRYSLLELKNRPGNAVLPKVNIVDMKKDRLEGDLTYFSFSLKKGVENRIERNEQTILYINRRGFAPNLKCSDCGHVPACPNCRIKLTWHSVGKKLSCHYCGYFNKKYDRCEKCENTKFIFRGAGTQRVEESIPRLFKGATISRLDSDTAKGRQQAFEILAQFGEQKTNLLLGTQMVTKGVDFPNVTLVGVLSADMNLDLPDFRASEKAFSKLLQVSGRSGRSDKKGEVLIQTYYPENSLITDAANQDYISFYKREIELRKELNYPPFSRLVKFLFSSNTENELNRSVAAFKKKLTELLKQEKISHQMAGPSECPLYFLRNQFRKHFFLKTKQVVKLGKLLTEWENDNPRFSVSSHVKIVIDVDPVNMM